ncbi:phosphoribosylformylglycinamidine cyclo-ligase [Metallumcola ferriviriculae]|uniref:Phosphoribosylformylglycinamidine cyclo-ligase n=1 Tax=Metallumcola ferriviriculae TaxID=3039180 RepID=A0AAU0USY2_9FIRM|nr:phosphoribosylformylglycinamidine cyclo-ligase [Desulfitibacteraceae bacterium MK1]
MPKGVSYKDAGVDIDAGNRSVELIKSVVKKTWRPEVLTDLGGFGGLFAPNMKKYKQPVLVSGTDGVGTKLRVAFGADRHDTIGIDAVAMCVNDILVQGAEPLFFLDYLAVGKLLPDKVNEIVTGVAEGCRLAGCALIGGETAEMPGFYGDGEYDIAGFAVGMVDREQIVDGKRIKAGDILIGLPSSGLHSNGYSLARKVLLDDDISRLTDNEEGLGRTLADELLEPTRIYVSQVMPLLEQFDIKGMAHITGGGLLENVPRTLPIGLQAEFNYNSWPVHPVFKLIQERGNVAETEMYRTFNMGIGFVLVVSPKEAEAVMNAVSGESYKIGTVVE